MRPVGGCRPCCAEKIQNRVAAIAVMVTAAATPQSWPVRRAVHDLRRLPGVVVVVAAAGAGDVAARECNPARMTVTRRRAAALDGRLLAAARAWRQ